MRFRIVVVVGKVIIGEARIAAIVKYTRGTTATATTATVYICVE